MMVSYITVHGVFAQLIGETLGHQSKLIIWPQMRVYIIICRLIFCDRCIAFSQIGQVQITGVKEHTDLLKYVINFKAPSLL